MEKESRSSASLAIRVPLSEKEEFLAEATEHGTLPTPYLTEIFRQRHSKTLTIQPNDEKLIARLEGKIEMLNEQNDKLIQQVGEARKSEGLGSIEGKQKSAEKMADERVDKKIAAWEAARFKEEHEKLKADKAALEAERDELKGNVMAHDRYMMIADIGGKFLASNPALNERVGSTLSGFLGGGQAGLSGPALTDEQQIALTVGETIMTDLAPIRPQILAFLDVLTTEPGLIKIVQGNKNFQAAHAAIVSQRNQQAQA